MEIQQLVQDWLEGRAKLDTQGNITLTPKITEKLSSKFFRAYNWITNHAIYSPYKDIEFGPRVTLGQQEQQIEIPQETSYCSFVLLPLLTLMTSRRIVLIGAPGRGKTTVATLMALLSGYNISEIRQAVQHGHPQLTISDLLGSPLPRDLVKAESFQEIAVSWRKWISMRVKIIDEYNRIPTKTQSALLSLMSEGYAEMYEQIVHSGKSAWFLTANDDMGGGTFPVIEALKDRIDIVVRCTPFNSRFLEELAERIATASSPDEFVPRDLVFTEEELATAEQQIRATEIPRDVLDILSFIVGQLEFCRRASHKLEFKTKDTLHLAGKRLAHVCNEDCPLDKHENLCTQTENGISARAYQSLLHYAKALAYFRGNTEVSIDEFRVLMPWVLHEKLKPNPQSAFFQKTENQVYITDKASWIQQIFDRAVVQYTTYAPMREPVAELREEQVQKMATMNSVEIRERMVKIQERMVKLLQDSELNGPVYEDLLLLKSTYSCYQNHLHNLQKLGE